MTLDAYDYGVFDTTGFNREEICFLGTVSHGTILTVLLQLQHFFSIIWSAYRQLEGGGEARATRPSLQGRRRVVFGIWHTRDRLAREARG